MSRGREGNGTDFGFQVVISSIRDLRTVSINYFYHITDPSDCFCTLLVRSSHRVLAQEDGQSKEKEGTFLKVA